MKRRPSGAPLIVLAIPLALAASPALAYVGPGAGITMLGALWGLIVAVGAAVGFVLLWPFRRYLFRKRRAGNAGREGDPGPREADHEAAASRPKSP